MLPSRFRGLWRDHDFLRLWAAQTVSLCGSQISLLAVPLLAALSLKATPLEMGILGAASQLPYLLVGLAAGVWVDRRRRRPILIAADLGRVVLIGSIPAVSLLGALTMPYLYVVTLLAGILAVFFDVAYQSLLPSLVQREDLVEGNSKLELSRSAALIAGPSLAGWLVQLVTAPIAIAVDAATFLVSAWCLGLIRAREAVPAPHEARRGFKEELGEGLVLVLRTPVLRAIAGCTGTNNFFDAMQLAAFILWVTRDLEIGPGVLGLILATGNVGLLLGALLAGHAARRFGAGPTIVGAAILMALARLVIPMASGSMVVAVSTLVLAHVLQASGRTLYNVNHLSLRQAITPDHLLGRVNASMRFLAWGAVPIGALAGGALGQTIGLRETLFLGGLGGMLGVGWLFWSPLPALRERPDDGGPGVARLATPPR